MQRRIIESHRRLTGQPPSEAELNLLETARRCEFYGMKMHPAKVGGCAHGDAPGQGGYMLHSWMLHFQLFFSDPRIPTGFPLFHPFGEVWCQSFNFKADFMLR